MTHGQSNQPGDTHAEKPETKFDRGEKKSENKERSEAVADLKSGKLNEHELKVLQKKLESGSSGVTGVGNDGGFASAKDIFGSAKDQSALREAWRDKEFKTKFGDPNELQGDKRDATEKQQNGQDKLESKTPRPIDDVLKELAKDAPPGFFDKIDSSAVKVTETAMVGRPNRFEPPGVHVKPGEHHHAAEPKPVHNNAVHGQTAHETKHIEHNPTVSRDSHPPHLKGKEIIDPTPTKIGRAPLITPHPPRLPNDGTLIHTVPERQPTDGARIHTVPEEPRQGKPISNESRPQASSGQGNEGEKEKDKPQGPAEGSMSGGASPPPDGRPPHEDPDYHTTKEWFDNTVTVINPDGSGPNDSPGKARKPPLGHPDYDPHSGTGEKFADEHRVEDPMSPSGEKQSPNDRTEEKRDVVEAAFDENKERKWPQVKERLIADEARELETTRQSYDFPAKAVQDRVDELKSKIAEDQRGRITLAAGVAEDAEGNRYMILGTSERYGYLRGIKPKSGEIVVASSDKADAEMTVLSYARDKQWKMVTIGATRPICDHCESAINDQKAEPVTPLKRKQ